MTLKFKIMKTKHFFSLALVFFALNSSIFYAQEQKSARLSLSYIKENTDGAYIKAKVRYKEDREYFPAKDLELKLYKITKQEDEDTEDISEKIKVSKTDDNGEVKFYLKPETFGLAQQFYEVRIENDANFKDKSDDISFKNAEIVANISQKDSLRTLTIKLVDPDKNPIANQYFKVKLKRLFGMMNVGDEDFYKTDEKGEISIDIEEKMYSKSGKLEFIITLDDSNDYGTIIEHLESDFGIVMESKDTFDERTMWATAAKAPIYMLIIPNVLLIGIWGIILVLFFNLYRIYKHN